MWSLRSHFRAVSVGAISLFLASCTSAIISVVDQVHPNATVVDKQYDVLAEISFHYEGRAVHTQRHFEYYLFRRHRDHREIERFYTMQRWNIVSLSENEAASIVIAPAPPPFEGEIAWTATISSAYRATPDSTGLRKCSASDQKPITVSAAPVPVPGITDLDVKLRRLPRKLGGYPSDFGDLKVTLPPTHTTEACDVFLKAGAVNTTIVTDLPEP